MIARHFRHERFNGRETTLVGRPGFKPGGRRHASPGGFDSHSLPPKAFVRLLGSRGSAEAQLRL
jgi:hypothetical protein